MKLSLNSINPCFSGRPAGARPCNDHARQLTAMEAVPRSTYCGFAEVGYLWVVRLFGIAMGIVEIKITDTPRYSYAKRSLRNGRPFCMLNVFNTASLL